MRLLPDKLIIFFQPKNNLILASLFLIVILFSCGKEPNLKGFDEESWRNDTRSCASVRPKLLKSFLNIQQNLVGLNHSEIIKILGRPEGESLETSGQRIYYYYLEKGLQCENKKELSNANRVIVRFSALDLVNEVRLENPANL